MPSEVGLKAQDAVRDTRLTIAPQTLLQRSQEVLSESRAHGEGWITAEKRAVEREHLCFVAATLPRV